MKRRAYRNGLRLAAALGLGAALGAAATPASALTIVTTFDSSITSMANSAQIQAAFNAIANDYAVSFSNPVTVHVTVSWGSVDGFTLPSNALGASVDPLYGYYSYSDIKAALAATAASNPSDTALAMAAAHLPATAPTGVGLYVVPSAEAKALGLISGDLTDPDGFIGFSGAASNYTFAAGGAIAKGTYDFRGVAAHELSEVLGTISGLESATPTFRTPFDLFRYKSKGVLGFTYDQAAYFSIDGGATKIKSFNADAGGGDRGDWLTGASSTDNRDAYMASGRRYKILSGDLTSLDVLGWAGSNLGDTSLKNAGILAFTAADATPEPADWVLMLAGFGLVGAGLRRRRIAAHA